MTRYIDCTLTVVNGNDWDGYPRNRVYGKENIATRVDRDLATVEEDGAAVREILTTTQSFTHIDVPRHWTTDGKAVHECGPEMFIGDAVYFDMTHKDAGGRVSRSDLEAIGLEPREDDIAIIGTGWTDEAWLTERFWTEMITLGAEAGAWLSDHGIKGLATDFYIGPTPVESCPHCGQLIKSGIPDHPNHYRFLVEDGIILYEWCTNLGTISEDRVKFYGFPMKIKDADGAPTRVVVEEESNAGRYRREGRT